MVADGYFCVNKGVHSSDCPKYSVHILGTTTRKWFSYDGSGNVNPIQSRGGVTKKWIGHKIMMFKQEKANMERQRQIEIWIDRDRESQRYGQLDMDGKRRQIWIVRERRICRDNQTRSYKYRQSNSWIPICKDRHMDFVDAWTWKQSEFYRWANRCMDSQIWTERGGICVTVDAPTWMYKQR